MRIFNLLNRITKAGTSAPTHMIGWDQTTRSWRKYTLGSGLSVDGSGVISASGGESWTRVTLGSPFTSTTQSTNEAVAGLGFTFPAVGVYDVRGVILVSNTSGTNATGYGISPNDSVTFDGTIFPLDWCEANEGEGIQYDGSGISNDNPQPFIGNSGLAVNNGSTARLLFSGSVALFGANRTWQTTFATYGAGALCTLDAGSYIEYIRRDA